MTQLTLTAGPRAEGPAPSLESGSIGGQGLRFFLIGSTGTALQLGLYALSATLVGVQVAAVASWLVSTLATNAAHRAFTFGVRGNQRNRTDQIAAFITCLVGLVVTSAVLDEVPEAAWITGVAAILVVNTVVGAARFVGMRWWLGDSGRRVGTRLAAVVRKTGATSKSHAETSPAPLVGSGRPVRFPVLIDSDAPRA